MSSFTLLANRDDIGGVRITVALRSNSKAVQHDPEHSKPSDRDIKTAGVSNGSQRDRSPGPETSSYGSGAEGKSALGGINGDPDDASFDFSTSPDVDSDGSNTDHDVDSQNDEFAEWKWLEQIDACAHLGKKKVAHCDAKLIRRDWMRYDFLTEIQEPDDKEASALGLDLFDRYGCLRREFYEHEIKQGKGTWGNELDQGDILLIGNITVDFLHRRNGIATKIVEAVLGKTRRKSKHFFAFARPHFASKLYDAGEERAHIETTIGEQFFRSLGFRRVGTSQWLAFANDKGHPSRRLDIMDDIAIFGSQNQRGVASHEMHAIMVMLHDASKTDVQCVRQIEQILYGVEDPLVSSTDMKGNSILHIAALNRRPRAIAYIRSQFDQLTRARNMEGYTPIEALWSALDMRRALRTFPSYVKVVSDSFQGFRRRDVACLAALTGIDPDYDSTSDTTPSMKSDTFPSIKLDYSSDVSTASDREELRDKFAPRLEEWKYEKRKLFRGLKGLQWKYGCTCGACIDGFLSPRMRFALTCQAELKNTLLLENTIVLKSVELTGREWCRLHDDDLKHVSPELRDQLENDTHMRDGFANICDLFARCLRDGIVPNETNIRSASRYVKHDNITTMTTQEYLSNGGTVTAVATMIFEKAMSEDQWAGDGTHSEDFKPPKPLPVCRNDHEFGFVSGMCGYERVTPSFSIKKGLETKVYGCEACENESGSD